jgi:hypothetical protein
MTFQRARRLLQAGGKDGGLLSRARPVTLVRARGVRAAAILPIGAGPGLNRHGGTIRLPLEQETAVAA